MDNQKLVKWGRRLYQAIVDAKVPAMQLLDIANAIRVQKKWENLAPDVKLAIMKIAALCSPDEEKGANVIDLDPLAVREEAANDNDGKASGATSTEGTEGETPRVA